MDYNINDREFHMSITVQEAYFLEEILERYLDDYVEDITKEKFKNPDADQTKAWGYYQRTRQAGLDLKSFPQAEFWNNLFQGETTELLEFC